MDAVEISLVIPAFNEGEGISAMVQDAVAVLSELFASFEIIVVDDGSSDDTSANAVVVPRVKLIRFSHNRGYGAALRAGFEQACGRFVAFTDADGQFDLKDLKPLRDAANPIAVGYRMKRQDTARRRFLSWGYNRLARVWLKTKVRDVDCALKVFRRDVLIRLLPESTGFFVNTEMLSRASALGYTISEVGVTHRPRRVGYSKVSLWEVPKTLRAMASFWWYRSTTTTPSTRVMAMRLPRVDGRQLEPVPASLLRRLAVVPAPLPEST